MNFCYNLTRSNLPFSGSTKTFYCACFLSYWRLLRLVLLLHHAALSRSASFDRQNAFPRKYLLALLRRLFEVTRKYVRQSVRFTWQMLLELFIYHIRVCLVTLEMLEDCCCAGELPSNLWPTRNWSCTTWTNSTLNYLLLKPNSTPGSLLGRRIWRQAWACYTWYQICF